MNDAPHPTPVADPGRVLDRLYQAVDDRHLSWLDDLTLAAGLTRRCACEALAPAAAACARCGSCGPEPGPAQLDRERPAFVIGHHHPEGFGIDDTALARWVAAKGDDLEDDLPRRTAELPGSDLSNMVSDALDHSVITADPDIELTVHGDDDCYSCGFYVILHNRHGRQRRAGLTTGWTELAFPDDPPTLEAAARDFLEQVCSEANSLLHYVITGTD